MAGNTKWVNLSRSSIKTASPYATFEITLLTEGGSKLDLFSIREVLKNYLF